MATSPGMMALATLDEETRKEMSAILLQAISQGAEIEVQVLDLGTARNKSDPFQVGSFKTLYVADATDSGCVAYFRPNSKSDGQGAIPIKKKDIFREALPFARGYLHWPQQTGKTMTIVLMARGEFQSGSQIAQQAGGVTIGEGATVTTRAITGLAITSTASVLLPADPDRLTETVYNGDTDTVYVGDANVTDPTGTYPGQPLAPGAVLTWKNPAALYAIKTGAGTLTKFHRQVQK